MTENSYGDIKIDSGSPAAERGPDVPLDQEVSKHKQDFSPHVIVSSSQPQGIEGHRRKRKRIPSLRFLVPSKKTVVRLLIIPLIGVLYGAGSYFLVPVTIKSLLVPKISQDLGRPVEISRIVFSPYTLELFLENLIVGPQHGDVKGKDLLKTENVSFMFSLKQILQGKFVCRKATVDGISLHLVRQQDSKVDLKIISDLFLFSSPGQQVQFWPTWFFMDEVDVTAGKVYIDDQISKRAFNIEQIRLNIPSAETRAVDQEAIPKLSAVIDSSPFAINALRFRDQSGAWRTGFSFEFKSIIVNKFRELLPLPDTGFQMSDGEADIVLDFILPESQQGKEGVVIEGEAGLKDIKWHDLETQTTLRLPEGRIVYRIVPSQKLFSFVNVEFHEPEISLRGKEGKSVGNPSVFLHAILERIVRADELLEVKSFLLNNGKLVISGKGQAKSKTTWNDVTFKIRDLTTAGHRKANQSESGSAAFSIRAKDLASKPVAEFYSEGELNSDADLKGKLEITNLDMALNTELLPLKAMSIVKGKSDISLRYELTGKSAPGQTSKPVRDKIYNGEFKTSGYVVNKNKKKALAGGTMSCRKFHLDMNSRTIICDQLDLRKSDIFSGNLFGKSDEQDDSENSAWKLLVNNLHVSGSKIHMPMKGFGKNSKTKDLAVENTELKVTSLQSERVVNNVKVTGRIGKKGVVMADGSYSSLSGRGELNIDISSVNLKHLQPYFSSWFVPQVTSGLLGAKGNLDITTKKFTGRASVSEFLAGDEGGTKVGWKRAYSDSVMFQSEPLSVALADLVVQQPDVTPGLSTGENPVNNFLQLKDEIIPPSVHLGKIYVEGGIFGLPEPIIYPGYQPFLKNINGAITLAEKGEQTFILHGGINNHGIFKIQGAGSLKEVRSYDLEVQDFPLLPFDPVLKGVVKYNSREPVASWKQVKNVENDHSEVETGITVQNIRPDSSDSPVSVLALLVGEDLRLSMDMKGEYTRVKPQPFLLEQFVKKLRHLKVKAAISPYLVLKSTNPSLELMENVVFGPGKSSQDNSKSLTAFQELMRIRPFVKLELQGFYDPVNDRTVLETVLQEEADRQREEENMRRALEKVKIMQKEQRRLKEMKAGKEGEVVEEIIPSEEKKDLQPLPKVKVSLPASALEDLAKKRAEAVRSYLVKEMRIDTSRVSLSSKVGEGSSRVKINILPFTPSVQE